MPENVATQSSPKTSREGLFLPCNQLLSLSMYPVGAWVDACTRKEFSIAQMEAALYTGGSAEGLHGSLHGANPPAECSTNTRFYSREIETHK